MFVMSLVFLMALGQTPLFLMLMLLVTLMSLRWHYLRRRRRKNFSKLKNFNRGKGVVNSKGNSITHRPCV